jgi:hypothetical protein
MWKLLLWRKSKRKQKQPLIDCIFNNCKNTIDDARNKARKPCFFFYTFLTHAGFPRWLRFTQTTSGPESPRLLKFLTLLLTANCITFELCILTREYTPKKTTTTVFLKHLIVSRHLRMFLSNDSVIGLLVPRSQHERRKWKLLVLNKSEEKQGSMIL